jgi:hypothetical protein
MTLGHRTPAALRRRDPPPLLPPPQDAVYWYDGSEEHFYTNADANTAFGAAAPSGGR